MLLEELELEELELDEEELELDDLEDDPAGVLRAGVSLPPAALISRIQH